MKKLPYGRILVIEFDLRAIGARVAVAVVMRSIDAATFPVRSHDRSNAPRVSEIATD